MNIDELQLLFDRRRYLINLIGDILDTNIILGGKDAALEIIQINEKIKILCEK